MSAFLSIKRFARLYLCFYIIVAVLIVALVHLTYEPANSATQQIKSEVAKQESKEVVDDEGHDSTMPETFQARQRRVTELCEAYHLGSYSFPNRTNGLEIQESPTPQYSYFFVNRKLNFAWCPVYKAGSTSWLTNMMLLAGYNEERISNPPKQLSIWAREVYGDGEPDEIFMNSKKLLIVRHPFERLVSAYRDKLANASGNFIHGTAHFYEKYGRKIVSKFRPSDSSLTQKEPTFAEFVTYLISTDVVYYDDHWLPVYFSCTPCLVHYDFIAKVETYTVDQERVISQMNFDTNIVKPKWKHKTGVSNSLNSGVNSINSMSAHALNYITSQVTEDQISRLYEKYRLDFELFGYTM